MEESWPARKQWKVPAASGQAPLWGRHSCWAPRWGSYSIRLCDMWATPFCSLRLSEPPTGKTARVTMGKERKQCGGKSIKSVRKPIMWKISLKKIRGTITSHIRSWSWWIQVENLTRIHIYIYKHTAVQAFEISIKLSQVFFFTFSILIYLLYTYIYKSYAWYRSYCTFHTPEQYYTFTLAQKKHSAGVSGSRG